MIKTIKINDLEIGSGQPKICIPLVASHQQQLEDAIKHLPLSHCDMVEFRADLFEDADKTANILNYLHLARQLLGEKMPVLFTFRSAKEGGAFPASNQYYCQLLQEVAASGLADIIDIEYFIDESKELVDSIKKHGCYTLLSNHDFHATPSATEIISRLSNMQKIGADIAKIAVMPQSNQDVLTLMNAVYHVAHQSSCPVIGISMGQLGKITRMCGELFGSALTFGTSGSASAPGQIDANQLADYLNAFALNHQDSSSFHA